MKTLLPAFALTLALSAALCPFATASPTFTRDIAPLVFENCTSCHRADNVGPFPLTNFEEVSRRAKQIVRVTGERIMPPWKPQPGHGEFRFDRSLSDAQIALFAQWLAAGKPFGNKAELPPLPKFPEGWELGKPDIILKLPKPFTIRAEGPDVYVHFPFSLNIDKEIYLNGIEVRPSNRRVAHHAVGLLDDSGKARKLDAATPEQGYERFGDSGFLPKGITPGYVPGQTPRRFAEGAGITIKKGTDLVLQMHYHPTGKVEQDQFEIGLYLTDKPPTRHMLGIIMGSDEQDIPPGEANYIRKDSFKLPVALKADHVWAHMHLIGKDVKVWADLPDGRTEKLLWINDWDFNWQDTYQFKKPILLPAGTVVHSEFLWDNTPTRPRNPFSPPRRIVNGPNSDNEMAGIWLGGELSNGLELIGLLLANVGHYEEIRRAGESFRKRHSIPEAGNGK